MKPMPSRVGGGAAWRIGIVLSLSLGLLLLRTDALLPDRESTAKVVLQPRAAAFARVFSPESALTFEPNLGQFPPEVRFVGRGGPLLAILTEEGITLRARDECDAAITLRVERGAPSVPHALEPSPGTSNYFIGNDPSRYVTDVPHVRTVRYTDVRPGIDLVCHGGTAGGFEYDLVVTPSADLDELTVEAAASGPIEAPTSGAVDHGGGISLRATSRGAFLQAAPVAYRLGPSGEKQPVAVATRLKSRGRIGFDVASADRTSSVVIDPVLTYSTLLGGDSADSAQAVAVGGDGSVYIAGTALAGFPASSGAYEGSCGGGTDAYVAKLSADGSSLIYATYLGGSDDDTGASIAVDATGNAYVAGQTVSADFPTKNAVQASPTGVQAGFVAMLGPNGSTLGYSSYLGGSDVDTATAVAVDAEGSAVVTGQTQSPTFPLRNSLQSSIAGGTDAFVTRLASGGATLVYSTLVGGLHDDEGLGIALDAAGNAYVTGSSFSPDFPAIGAVPASGSGGAFAFEIAVDGSSLVYSTCLGSAFDQGQAVAVDPSGNTFFAGLTTSGFYPTVHALPGKSALDGSADGFVTKIAAGGTSVVYSTLLGGSGFDGANGVGVDSAGDAFVIGTTYSTDFPTNAPLQTNPITRLNGVAAFVSELKPDDSGFVYSTYLGGAGSTYGFALAMTPDGGALVAGATGDLDFPTQNAFQPAFATSTAGSQAFVAEISAGSRAVLSITPSPASVAVLGSVTFRAKGGSGGGYRFRLADHPSGGSVDPTTGLYVAGAHGGVLDVVEVVDSSETTAAAAILVDATADGGTDGGDAGFEGGAPIDAHRDVEPSGEGGRFDAAHQDAAEGEAPAPVPVFLATGSECALRQRPDSDDSPPLLVVGLLGLSAILRRGRRPSL
jgi:Beta-propeller repeat